MAAKDIWLGRYRGGYGFPLIKAPFLQALYPK